MAKKKTLKRRNAEIKMRGNISNRAYRQALADMLALFHAVNSHHIPSANPYTFDAVVHATYMLFGDGDKMTGPEYWSLEEMTSQIVATNGHALLFSTPNPERPPHLRRVVCVGNQIGMVDADGDVVPADAF